MQFELNQESPNRGIVTLNNDERAFINYALLSSLIKAATVGPQLELESPLYSCAVTLLNPQISANILHVSGGHLEALATVVSENSTDIAFEQAEFIGGLISQLSVAAKVLGQRASMESSIDEMVENIVIPDSPEGLEGTT